jgi:hypothetical protein
MERDLKIKFWMTWIKNFIIVNPVRSIFFVMAVTITTTGLLQKEVILFKEIIGFFQDEKKCYYQLDGSRSYIEYSSPQKVYQYDGDNYLKVMGYSEQKMFFLTAGTVLFVIFIISLFPEDLELKQVLKKTMKSNYKEVFVEDPNNTDLYYSISYNKVFFKSHFSKNFYSNWEASAISNVSDFFNCEDYFTKSELRDIKLSKLGIK